MSKEIQEAVRKALDEILPGLASEAEKKSDEVKAAHKELDGRIAEIQKDMENMAGKTDVANKDEFLKQQEKCVQLENELKALTQKQAELLGERQPEEAKGYAQLAAESKAAEEYRGGNVVLAEYKGSAFGGPSIRKDVTSLPASAGELIVPYSRPGILMQPEMPLTIRNFIPSIPISTPAIEWFQEKVFTNNAQTQAAEKDVKGQSNITFEKKASTSVTIAHWIPATRQILQDVPALRGIIESKMRYGLALEEETQILTGGGTPDLNGLIPQATAYNTGLNVAGDTPVDRIRRAIYQAELALYPVDSIMMNHKDWTDMELQKDANNNYLFTKPQEAATPRLWGKAVHQTFAIAAGSFLTGGFMTGATIWDQEQVTVRATDSHADFFVRNQEVILVEERVMFTVERPASFITGSFA